MSNVQVSDTAEHLLAGLIEALSVVPGLVVTENAVEEHLKSHDARVELEINGRPLRLVIECKREVFPQRAREILWQLREYLHPGPEATVVPFVMAHSITTAARDLLKHEGVGYYDDSGTLFLPAPGSLVYIEKAAAAGKRTVERSMFTERRSQAVHALLREPKRWFGVTELANAAQIAPATASEVLTCLDNLEWAKSRGQGPSKERRLVEPGQLLDDWASAFKDSKRHPLQRYFIPQLAPGRNPEEQIAEVFERHGVTYALTHESAAQRLSPLLTNVAKTRMRVRSGEELTSALKELRAQTANLGWNLGLGEANDGDLMFREREGLWLASVFHIYLDLVQSDEGRAKELAQHLRKERIGF